MIEDPGAPGYWLSRDGRVKGPSGKWLKLFTGSNDYLCFKSARSKNDQRTRKVHIAICEAYHGPRPDGLVVRHMNGNALDNRAANLKWGTYEENAADKVRHGTVQRGEVHHRAKLGQDDVDEIRKLLISARAPTQAAIAELYGVTQQTVSSIKHGRSWAWDV